MWEKGTWNKYKDGDDGAAIAKKTRERNISGASDFHHHPSSATISNCSNVINCLFITTEEKKMCFVCFGRLSKKTASKARANGMCTKKLHRDVTTERVKAKKAMNIGERNKYMDVQTSRSWSQQQLNFFLFHVQKIFNFTKNLYCVHVRIFKNLTFFLKNRKTHFSWIFKIVNK